MTELNAPRPDENGTPPAEDWLILESLKDREWSWEVAIQGVGDEMQERTTDGSLRAG